MVFSSIVFLLYFLPVFLTIYFILPDRFKNTFLLIASILFYSWGAPLFIFVILGTTFLDFHLVKFMYGAKKNAVRKLLLCLSVGMNLGLLFYYKYFLFFIENLNSLLKLTSHQSIVWEKIALPIGISFFTFESLTYVIDVYRGVHAPLQNFRAYQLYIILFPKLIAGPIVRYHEIADQIFNRFAKHTANDRISGLFRFIIGLSKKVLIANVMAEYADKVFLSDLNLLSTRDAWLGALCYTFQIYFDFSGYSDMAIGLLKIMGFEIPENFNAPYVAKSVTEFWKRWHISLGSWMRNYLYIPLGGNQVQSKWRLYFNLITVFLVSGLWHGASWNFIVWGAYHGFWLVLERAWLNALWRNIPNLFRVAFTFVVVVVGWVFFRTETLSDASQFLTLMISANSGSNLITNSSYFFTHFTFAVLFSFSYLVPYWRNQSDPFYFCKSYSARQLFGYGLLCLILLILCLGRLAIHGFNPFIYFRF